MMSPNQTLQMIEAWVRSNIEKQGYMKYDDLHIDHIHQEWRARESWIEGGLEAFQVALDVRNRQAPNLSVALTFSLTAGEGPRGVNFQTLEEMKAELGGSPPSLYLFQKGAEPWTQAAHHDRTVPAEEVVVKNLNPDIFARLLKNNRCYYMEFKQAEFRERSRSVLVAG